MGCLAAVGLTAIVVAMGAGMTALTGLLMGLATTIATSMVGFIAFLLVLI
ncbi:MAG: hypothetical protein OEV52_05320 [Dehalococcoidia bacterium]|nr:hypothetical protein [Dehalococcoidia bacterium]MDH4291793.1 hypothetical protein [Dehalococcoidia bacterium]